MAKLLTILINEHPSLRKKANLIKDPSAPEINQLADDMIYTMRQTKGVGLAANQVGKNIRLVVVETKDGPLSLINPEIVKQSAETELGEEGCLSVPDVYGFVRRSKEITLHAYDKQGNRQIHEAQGLFARVLQHEVDHIDGILFIDKVEGYSDEQSEKKIRAL